MRRLIEGRKDGPRHERILAFLSLLLIPPLFFTNQFTHQGTIAISAVVKVRSMLNGHI